MVYRGGPVGVTGAVAAADASGAIASVGAFDGAAAASA